MVSYKKIMKSGIVKKPIRSGLSVFSTFRHSKKASLPFKLKMESSGICNLKCRMCPLVSGLKRKQGFLKFENFKYVFDQIKPAYLNLTGIGEPLLNPDLFKIIKYAKKKKAMVKFDTNGVFLTEENVERILDSNIDIVSISIDGTDKKTYEAIRVGSNFELVKKNVKKFVELRNRHNSETRIHMFFVLQSSNIEKLPQFIRLANELGVDYMAGSFVVTLGDNKNESNKKINNKLQLNKILVETREEVKKSKTEVSIDPLIQFLEYSGNRSNYNENKPCYMPWYSVFITWDGWVNPCDFSCDNEVVFGNAFEEPFKKIWNGEKIKKFRMDLLKNRDKISICKGCGVDETYILKEINKIRKFPLMKYLQYGKN